MKASDFLITGGARGGGRTHTLAKACLESGATLVCHSYEFAEYLKQRHPGLKAVGMAHPDKLRGLHFILDHYVNKILWYEREVELSKKIKELIKRANHDQEKT